MNTIEHIGYLTGNIEASIEQFKLLGYTLVGGTIIDYTQKTRICFIQKQNETKIELVEPLAENEPMLKMLKKRGTGPYHICYEVEDVYQILEAMNKSKWLPIFNPVPAPAFNNRLICYMFKKEVGYIEFLNKQ